jgi:alkylation response protein AidB-like acyl-CoA dehydrogenase
MTEPQGGADPKVFSTTATQAGDDWVIDGEKWFQSSAREAAFFIVMAVSDPDNVPYERMSMFIVPAETPGIAIVRDVGLGFQPPGTGHHPYVRFRDVRVPGENLLGPRGGAFAVAQTRLGGGRIHHAMRTVGVVRRALELMCERAVSRTTQGETLGSKQLVQEMIADSWLELEQYRLLTLQTAWKIDRYKDYRRVRADIAAVKALMPQVCSSVVTRAIQVHGSLGVSNEMPFVEMLVGGLALGLADGPTEVHKLTLARELLRDVEPSPDAFPTHHTPRLAQAAEERFRDIMSSMYDRVG